LRCTGDEQIGAQDPVKTSKNPTISTPHKNIHPRLQTPPHPVASLFWNHLMDWAGAIDHNRDQLLRILAALFAMAGLSENAIVTTLPRHLYRAVLHILKPAESAVRRLIILAARDLVLKARTTRSASIGSRPFPRIPAPSVPAFPLIDPRKQFAPEGFVWGQVKSVPRIRSLEDYGPLLAHLYVADTQPSAPTADDPLSATRLCRRLLALKLALDDLPKQARRMARLDARRDMARETRTPLRPSLLPACRPGRPPGLRKRPVREIDYVLRECHDLVLDMYSGDTS
jgi:hypothetical protein